jgi:hypothetical protein
VVELRASRPHGLRKLHADVVAGGVADHLRTADPRALREGIVRDDGNGRTAHSLTTACAWKVRADTRRPGTSPCCCQHLETRRRHLPRRRPSNPSRRHRRRHRPSQRRRLSSSVSPLVRHRLRRHRRNSRRAPSPHRSRPRAGPTSTAHDPNDTLDHSSLAARLPRGRRKLGGCARRLGDPAVAGEYPINACQSDRLNYSTQAFDTFATRGMKWARKCNPVGPGLRGLITGNVVRGGRVARGAQARYVLDAPAGARALAPGSPLVPPPARLPRGRRSG